MCELNGGAFSADRVNVDAVRRNPNGTSHVSAQIRAPGRIRLIAVMRAASAVIALAALAVACGREHEPRTFSEFREDGLARDGVLAGCEQDADKAKNDVECENARRAAAAV